MRPDIVKSAKPVTLVGGGDARSDTLKEALTLAPSLVAADGGARVPLQIGLIPEAVIGDFDSLPEEDRETLPGASLFHIADQDSTDFDKALRHISAPLILGVGFLGARVDHQLASFNVLVRRPDRRCVLIGAEELVFLCPPRFSADLGPDAVLSLFPMGPVSGWSEGLEWPISGIDFAPDGRVGTSNRTVGPLTLEIDRPAMLVITPRAALDVVVQALLATDAHWPVPSG